MLEVEALEAKNMLDAARSRQGWSPGIVVYNEAIAAAQRIRARALGLKTKVTWAALKLDRDGGSFVSLLLHEAAYLELAPRRRLPLASLDRKLRAAAAAEHVGLLGV